MKVGTDAVLLGAWVEVGADVKRILDVGTGCGVIALMMAQRSGFDARIDAVETDESSVLQARENVRQSPWPDKVQIHHTPVQVFNSKTYDLVVSNPPYFSKSLLPPASGRKAARHTETLSFAELIENAKRLLSPKGTLAVILPVAEGSHFRDLATSFQLHCHRSAAFFSRRGKPQERWLLEFSFPGVMPAREPETIVLYEYGDQWTSEYSRLTGDFYLR
jgi:tRNA1Val (adenine37-N6)-methyltransferase